MGGERHVLLLIEHRHGEPIREWVHAAELADRLFRLLFTPGFVQGIAAGDEFRFSGDDGAFEVTRRGGNLAIQVFSDEPVAARRAELATRVARLGGTLDGAVGRGLSFSVPIAAGFPAIEAVFRAWVNEHPGWEWYFGNVYAADGVTPLGWWA